MQHTEFIPRITLFKSAKQEDIFCPTTVNLKYVKCREQLGSESNTKD